MTHGSIPDCKHQAETLIKSHFSKQNTGSALCTTDRKEVLEMKGKEHTHTHTLFSISNAIQVSEINHSVTDCHFSFLYTTPVCKYVSDTIFTNLLKQLKFNFQQ